MKPNFNEEKKLWKHGFKCVVGLDEAGRGPLAGPVVAAAVNFSTKGANVQDGSASGVRPASGWKLILNDPIFKQIKDSKQMTEKQREEIYEILIKHPNIKWGVGIVSEKIIDKINILEATKLAMARAIKNLNPKPYTLNPDFLILDGNFKLDKVILPQKSIIKGDQKVFSVAAASIIAKVTRDRLMQKYHKKYPQYGFGKHKGYGTKAHFACLEKFGPCKIHRKTFWPVSAM